MCRPPSNATPTTRRVVIAGAGPAGLLLQALLHHRNKQSSATSGIIYDITLIESRDDLGQLNQEELQSHRSWMIGLAGHGLEAVRSIPGLYENYLSNVGVKLTEGSIFIGSKKLSMGSQNKNSKEMPEGFIVDRNFIVAALARYAKDNLQTTSEHYTSKYNTELLYVDSTNQRVLIRFKTTNEEEYVSYDLLVGADGIRSTVREALVKRHYDFELHVNDIFNTFKAVHIQRPECLSPSGISFLPGCLPNFNGIVLPETGDLINLSMGVSRNHFENGVSDDLKSDDPKVVANYFKENFKAFQLEEEVYLDWATQWVNQRWNRTGQVHCNKYSSLECKIVLMGDSAHATSPSIGMGMNTALRDAQKLYELLEKYDDNLEKVLPQYSIDRVPEGNALSDIALNLYCFDTKVQMKSMLKGIIRSGLHYMLPNLVDPDPQTIIGTPENTMADVYQMSIDQGTLTKHRVVNDRIRQEFFEKEVGMVKEKKEGKSLLKRSLMIGIPVLAAYAYTMLIGVLRARETFNIRSSRHGEVLYQVQERKLRVRDTMKIEDGNGDEVAKIKKREVGVVRDNFVVKVRGDRDWQIHGAILDHDFTVKENGKTIVKVHKNWVTPIKDCYFIDIDEDCDDKVLALMVVIGLEDMSED